MKERETVKIPDPVKPGFTIERAKEPSRLTWKEVLLLFAHRNEWRTNGDIGNAFGLPDTEARHLTRLMFEAGVLERTRTPGTRFGLSYRLILKEI